jgi:hypothetical protein
MYGSRDDGIAWATYTGHWRPAAALAANLHINILSLKVLLLPCFHDMVLLPTRTLIVESDGPAACGSIWLQTSTLHSVHKSSASSVFSSILPTRTLIVESDGTKQALR